MSTFEIILLASGWLVAAVILIFMYGQKVRQIEAETQRQVTLAHNTELSQKINTLELQNKDLQQKYFEAEGKNRNAQEVTQQMKDAFQALSHQTLEGQTRQFIEFAQQTLSKHTELAKADLDKRHSLFDGTLAPLKATLDSLQKQTSEMEKERLRSYQAVEEELRRVVEGSAQLTQETRSLKNALKKPHVRGRWGEVQLRNCVELAGMSEYADVNFQDQSTVDGQILIPDMTVKMPGGRIVVVDAKTPIDGFLAALEATTDEQKNFEMGRHGQQVKDHIKKLSLRKYNEFLKESADFTVMFLPNESFLYAALETQPDLVEYALEKKILIATPPTFVGLLKVIRFGWNEERLAKNAEKISDAGKELHKRIVEFVENFVNIGKSISKASDQYDKGLRQLNSKIIVQAKRMEKLGAKSVKDLPELLDAASEAPEDALQISEASTTSESIDEDTEAEL